MSTIYVIVIGFHIHRTCYTDLAEAQREAKKLGGLVESLSLVDHGDPGY